MAKKGKSKSSLKKYMPILLLAGGVAIAVFGQRWFSGLISRFVDGIGYKFSKVKLKIKNLTSLQLSATMTVTNTNSVGGKVNGFDGSLRYGRNGQQLLPVKVGEFNLPANGSVDAPVSASVNLFQLAANAADIAQMVIGGEIKKLWIVGNLRTSFVNLPVEEEVTIFQE